MKKIIHIATAFFLGIIVTASSGTVFAEIQSLIGKKVTGEMDVIVNGEKLQDKGAVIEGRTNVPVRALANSLGADIKVNGDTVTVTTTESPKDNVVVIDGKYYTKYELLNKKTTLEENLSHVKENGEKDKSEYEKLKEEGKLEGPAIWEARLKSTEDTINRINTELNKVNEALKSFE